MQFNQDENQEDKDVIALFLISVTVFYNQSFKLCILYPEMWTFKF